MPDKSLMRRLEGVRGRGRENRPGKMSNRVGATWSRPGERTALIPLSDMLALSPPPPTP